MKRITATAIISITGGIMVHLVILTVIRIEPPVGRAPFEDSTSVRYVGNLNQEAAPAILQQAALFDSAPLFMPTRWNPASQMADVASLKEATEIFERFPARLLLPGFEPQSPGKDGVVRVEPELPSGPAFALGRYGRVPADFPDDQSSGPSVHILRLSGSTRNFPEAKPLPSSLDGLAPPALWTPTQFYLHLSAGMPAGPPVLRQSSGFVDWDRALQGFIASLDFYGDLGDGYYHLLVYP